MLKLIYTETSFRLERVNISLETWVSQRVTLTLHAGQKLIIETSRASFLLPAKDPRLTHLEQLVRAERGALISMIFVDDDYIEISLPGTWMTERIDADEGLFVTTFPSAIELAIYRIWYTTQSPAPYLC
ncbi:hypothetical protein GS597_03040 [Synechococcales cyanobacterium C]|uniref:Uncharacterized protein n=1 Tax=Petrachloros mirabilis ULC683 TaxID=2781853 RepID=A0A8K1ZWQ1_9CYAN|nr:alr0857 family protein [Petrachloros mirabilis]NCJ05506.1 hypothetical protein [Petrachloros mirabilis ULC683]